MTTTAPGLTLALGSPDDTTRFAHALGGVLAAGDTVLLDGPVGAGKSFLARALIRSLQEIPEDVPSPTFTLVQTYHTRAGEIWHADLYRLGGPDEIDELGLSEAFDTAICLIEWPDRLGPLVPDNALTLRLDPDSGDEDARHARLRWRDPKWKARLERLRHD
ncbi:tRNA (adenosine(37)-N6)-threonylcarbamoyltransferase complex ATPase subunit type 1 TsaE [Pukyongiella litopenaei]|uniref:tRNA threonylcarbamoyladenosine biosynthesis protein TsaE n=1 Tax=Pukyongiella litopenaei TaxID=2605946 RepID=A0A2S0MS96_9RHOB|nr:tRNA (adenosine(37)-N6)-threonylcarbamoyltransferase complex ATPase subunit type 1 TsaE [Pukyongiella litopenaei]AVO38769.1 tRNA (adenosine(37)-N6)-threonylcarbamoyltransferase complex ATPase subunit type 1 TsaE [Pukyongiella litopenaei]